MKSSTNQGKKTITATEGVAGESKSYTLIVRKSNGTVIETRPLVTPTEPPPPPPPPPVPVATVGVTVAPTGIKVGETAQATVVLKDIAGNVLTGRTVTFAASAPNVATVGQTGTVTAISAGTTTITATSEGISGSASVAVAAVEPIPDPIPPPPPPPPPPPGTPPALPQSTPPKTLTVDTTIRRVAAGGDLQAALNLGGTILLAPGAVFTGEYTLPQGVTGELRTDIPKTPLDALDRRMTPTKARALNLAKLVAPGPSPVLRTVPKANPTANWIISDIEITGILPKTSIQYGLVTLGDGGWLGGGETQVTLENVPRNFLLDRVYLHGADNLNCTRGLALNSANTTLLSSWFGEIHAAGFDSQAVCGWNGPGPYLLEDCTFEGAGENTMFGGADPGIPGLVPSDVTFRRCHFPKPLTWKGAGWSVKNLFETKNVQRVLVDACVFEHCWPASQEGFGIVIKSSRDADPSKTWQGSQDITFRWCHIDDVAVGLNLQAVDGESTKHVARILVEDCLFTNVGGGRNALMLLTHDLKDITVNRTTMLHAVGAAGLSLVTAYANGQMAGLGFTGNLLTATAGYAITNDGGPHHAAALETVAPGSWVFKDNTVVGISGDFVAQYPTGNQYPATMPSVVTAGVDRAELLRRISGVAVAP
jgi:hypothetical protein